MNLQNIIDNKYSGILVVSDIHSMYDLFAQAVAYATENNLFIIFLGDLVDTGNKPYEVVTEVKKITDDNRAVLTIGNHDDKYHRYYTGNNIELKASHLETLYRVGHDRLSTFLKTYSNLVTGPNSNSYYYFGNTFFVHAGLSSSFYNKPNIVPKKKTTITMYGETTGKRLPNGFPERLYNWVDLVPAGYIVVVGHDRAPYNVNLQGCPRIVSNANSGQVFFTDTGCGKGGNLTGTVFSIHNDIVRFNEFKEFK